MGRAGEPQKGSPGPQLTSRHRWPPSIQGSLPSSAPSCPSPAPGFSSRPQTCGAHPLLQAPDPGPAAPHRRSAQRSKLHSLPQGAPSPERHPPSRRPFHSPSSAPRPPPSGHPLPRLPGSWSAPSSHVPAGPSAPGRRPQPPLAPRPAPRSRPAPGLTSALGARRPPRRPRPAHAGGWGGGARLGSPRAPAPQRQPRSHRGLGPLLCVSFGHGGAEVTAVAGEAGGGSGFWGEGGRRGPPSLCRAGGSHPLEAPPAAAASPPTVIATRPRSFQGRRGRRGGSETCLYGGRERGRGPLGEAGEPGGGGEHAPQARPPAPCAPPRQPVSAPLAPAPLRVRRPVLE